MLKVLFVASECAPIVKVGGLGDVIGSLPKALSGLGVDVKIILPFYEVVDRRIWKPKSVLNLDSKTSVWKTRLPKSKVEVLLVYNKKYLSTGPVYFQRTAFAGTVGEIERFKFFSQAVYRLLTRNDPRGSAIGWQPDVVHCHDWHSGFLVKLIKPKTQNPKPKIVFTIHNLANQGVWRGENLMAEGIKNADIVTTVSPTYAKEILTKEYGGGLEKLLRRRKKNLVGILNGIDYDFWPQKHARSDNTPTFGLVSRLTYQKGIDLVASLVGEFVKKYKAQFWFLGQGEPQNEKALKELAKKYPKNVFTVIGFDEKRARKIYRESDFFLMPSRFEPSGLGQMISMHYGTVPIVRATGGLKDSVKHLKTGFVFKKESVADLRKVMELAVQCFYDKKKFVAISQRGMKQDFSWNKSANKYRAVYKTLLGKTCLENGKL